ncbi:RNA-directed DNA polymerase, eukaryota, reverse transcriptase zinc-binding domain protein [Tanacetum coccineum]
MRNVGPKFSQDGFGGDEAISQTEVNSQPVVDVCEDDGDQDERIDTRGNGLNKEMKDHDVNQGTNTQNDKQAGNKPSYVKIASNACFDNKLTLIPIEINENGIKVVIFDEELVSEGSKKWELTVCGYFVGYKMSLAELRNNMFRMWSKFGLKRIIPNGNGVFLFKFNNNEGIQSVIELGPWMVKGKPMNLPLEAWTTKGISAVASRLGTPLIMDQVTSNMCNAGNVRVGFARVLIDVEASKGLLGKIEIVYKNREGLVTGKKNVDVNYDWAPPMCSFCKVFGHYDKNCKSMPRSIEECMEDEREELRKEELKKKQDGDGFKKNGPSDVDKGKPEEIREQMLDKGKSDNVNENENGNEEEVIDVYDETSCYERKMAQNDIGLTWNIKGLGNRSKQNAVKDLIVDEKLSICAVLETRLKDAKVKRIGNRVFGRWTWYDNVMECNKGCRVLIGWNSELIQCGIIHASDQAVLCLFDIQNSNQRLFCTFIQAEISGKLRRKLWANLSNYKSIINDIPWVIMRDLNVSLNLEDHSKGMSHLKQDMEEFRDCINHVQIKDICSSGLHYTWIKSLLNPNNKIMKKIDRVMGSEEFFRAHSRSHVVFLPYGISDHSPAILTCPQTLKAKKRSFRFANYVADKQEFQGLVKEKWKPAVEGFAMFKLVKMLKAMKSTLNKLNWKNGNLFEKVKKLKLKLDEIQTKIIVDPTNISLREQGVCLDKEYITTLEDEEKLLHFQKFLGVQENMECLDLDEYLFLNKISPQDAGNMINDVTNKEIKDAMFDINDNKAPGPDGFTARFFKKAWDIVGNDVCLAVNELFTKGNLLEELNAAIITLVPKLLKGYDNGRGPKICSMKIDIQKAYDTMNWKFLKDALRHGFFKRGRGLRQGDPLSPYLFTMELEITHICFADDLLVLCHRDVASVKVIKTALDKFSSVYGLFPNLGKSTIFCGSMDRGTIGTILQILPFKKGKLLVRYLVYWASVFKLPKGVIDDIEKTFKGFLWNKGDLQKGKAKVAWKDVCQPKQNGGLGLKPLKSWNNALLIKHLWNVANKKDSLWVKWINTVKLKGMIVWEMEKQNNDSWLWKSLLDLRCKVRPNMIYKIGNGKITSWEPIGMAKLLFEKYPILLSFSVPRINDSTEDRLVWRTNEGILKPFSTNQAWNDIRILNGIVQWWKVIWFSQNIPSHAFVSWMTMKNKLVTHDKLAAWYPGKVWNCSLWKNTANSHEHLFFEFELSEKVGLGRNLERYACHFGRSNSGGCTIR